MTGTVQAIEVATELGVSIDELSRWVNEGSGPPRAGYDPHQRRVTWFARGELDVWLAQMRTLADA